MQVLDELRLVGQAGDLVVVAILEVRAKQRLGEDPDGEEEPAGDQRACGMGERPGRVDRDGVGDQDAAQEDHPGPDRHAVEARHQGDDRDRQPGQRRAARAAGDGDADSERQLGHQPGGGRPVLGAAAAVQTAVEVDRTGGCADQRREGPPAGLPRGAGDDGGEHDEHERARSADASHGGDKALAVHLGTAHPRVLAHACSIGIEGELRHRKLGVCRAFGGSLHRGRGRSDANVEFDAGMDPNRSGLLHRWGT